MRDRIEEIEARGASLVIIGNGSAEFAQAFREDLDVPGTILVDPDLITYRGIRLPP